MNHKPHYFRPDDHLYPIASHPTYGFEVGQSADEQVILGRGDYDAIQITFDLQGVLLHAANLPLARKPQTPEEFDRLFGAFATELRRVRHLRDVPIRVQRFWLPGFSVGIADLPCSLAEFVDAPESFDAEETANFIPALRSWRRGAEFAFWWGAEFEVNGKGQISAS